jgi:flagellar M-ring protein FliF
VEKNLEERAQSLLNATLGPDLSMARVTAELDFSQSEKTEEHYDPEEPVIRSEQINEEKSGSEIVGGIPGVQSNLQGNSAPPATATPPSSRMQRTTNYEISKVVSKTINPVGTIKKISVAVLVADKKTAGKKNEPPRYEPRSADELNSLKNMISSALGLDMKRGDQIEVTSMPFTDTSKTREVEAVAQESTFNQYLPLIRYSLLLLGGLLVYLLMVRPLIKTLRQDVTEHYKTVEQLEAEQAMEGTGEGKRRYSADPLLRIREEVSDDPTLVTHVVKTWINEK